MKISGKGGEIDVINAAGSLTVDGDFYGPVRADKVTQRRTVDLREDGFDAVRAGGAPGGGIGEPGCGGRAGKPERTHARQ